MQVINGAVSTEEDACAPDSSLVVIVTEKHKPGGMARRPFVFDLESRSNQGAAGKHRLLDGNGATAEDGDPADVSVPITDAVDAKWCWCSGV
ncbi:uncharacterized protein UV8b_02885 [Ustilaginoidea virens]|uniref:Uncharacterized protein n=1 Tax=Ustilaginoidea virens TaxID=1159556 RepID=A0A8E5HPC7_USTVR|nr:uncharacterized protein UV8b_02885 [Ustilaginoidea virens]QUC18644.1 hypothetical protein UV8b_02885 [Ustilaginoidea virens]